MIGIFGLVVVAIVSVYQFAANGVASTGVPPGQRLHWFAAPLASSSLVGDANLRPPCTLTRHDPRALNICLVAARRPLVLSFFVIGSNECEQQVDALQVLSRRYPTVQFAAVAIHASRPDTAALIRSHGWTIPVAYDRDGGVGSLYGVTICPMAELADRGGIVRDRLVGDQWDSSAALAEQVQALLRGQAGASGGLHSEASLRRRGAREDSESSPRPAAECGFPRAAAHLGDRREARSVPARARSRSGCGCCPTG